MKLPTISVINFSNNLNDQDVQEAIRAINRQVLEDFMPIWGSGRICRLHASKYGPSDEETLSKDPMMGESVIYLVDQATLAGALGYHSLNSEGRPFGFVYTEFLEDWTVTFSHEVLELIVDPIASILVPGPDPRNLNNLVLHTYEVCDAVERTSYLIDGIRLSNFVTPQYFTYPDERGTRNDFLGVGVKSFNATPGSHLAFFDLATNDWVTWFGQQESPFSMLAKRAKSFHYDRKDRPDDKLNTILAECQCKDINLGNVKGISRGSRYKLSLNNLT